ncbi:hypothetical protein LSAT2_008483, partial [Lamellibrachia satsuma]
MLHWILGRRGHIDNYNKPHCHNTGLESFKVAYLSPPWRVISYNGQTTAAIRNSFSLPDPCQRD